MHRSTSHPLRRVVSALETLDQDGENLYVTINAIKGEVLTFSTDNWGYMRRLADDLINEGVVGSDDTPTCVVVVRRFDGPPAPGERLPPKTVAGYLLTGITIYALTAEQQRDANETDSRTGAPLAPEPYVSFAHGLDMLPELRGIAQEMPPFTSRRKENRSDRRRRSSRR